MVLVLPATTCTASEDERNAERNSYVAESQSSPDGLLTDMLVNKPAGPHVGPDGPHSAPCTI
ncbi:unnamed protein product, partial [Rotaria sp. Silwood2]